MLGERLNSIRKKAGITAQEMANSLDITERSYRFYEAEKRYPSLDTLVKIADILNVTTDYLLSRDDFLKSHEVFVDERIKNLPKYPK